MRNANIYNSFYNKEKWALVNQANKDIIKDYEEELIQKKKKISTIKQYKNDWRIVLIKVYDMFDNKCITELKKKEWRRLSIYFQTECGHSNARVNRLLSATRSLMTYVEEDDEYDYETSTAGKVKGLPRENVREIHFLTNDQVIKIKEELIRREDYIKATMLMLAYDSAGRKSELYQAKKASFINPRNNSTNTVVGKRGKEFELVFFSGTKECAKLYLEQRGQDDIEEMWVIGSGDKKSVIAKETIYDWFKYMAKILEELEGEYTDFNVHSLRHSCLENLGQDEHSHYALIEVGRPEGMTLEELQAHANHENSSITQGYLKNRTSERKLKMFNLSIIDEDDEDEEETEEETTLI